MVSMITIRRVEFVLFSFHFEERVIFSILSYLWCWFIWFCQEKVFLWHQNFSYCSSKAQTDRLDKHNHNQAPRSHSSDQNVHYIINIFQNISSINIKMFNLIIIMSFDILLTKHQNSWASCEEMNQQKESRFSESWASFAIVWVIADMGEGFQNRTKCFSFAEICSEE